MKSLFLCSIMFEVTHACGRCDVLHIFEISEIKLKLALLYEKQNVKAEGK